MPLVLGHCFGSLSAAMQQTEEYGHKEQCRHGRQQQTAYYRPAEWSILLAAFAQVIKVVGFSAARSGCS